MKIRDIVNRDIVNLTNCELEPIHIPGSIQPHGFLLGILADSWIIDFCSGNIEEFTGLTYQQLLSKTFAEVFGEVNESLLKDYTTNNGALSSPLSISLVNSPYLCTVHKSNNTYVLEAEPLLINEKKLPDAYEQTKQFLYYMEQTSSLSQLCASVAKGTREITGYDRVMIYRFDEDYNGEIIAESKRDDLEPFFGLHYPHTDIPAQARVLYMKNILRLIADINYSPVPLYTIDDTPGKNLDLSLSVLRSTSPIHVEYLQNMGVGATLTISLIHNNRLWGLIACHHYAPKNLPHPLRIAAQLQGHFITSQIDVRQSNEEYDIARKSNEALEKLLSKTFELTYQSFESIVNEPSLLELCNASGACIIVNDTLYKGGKTPADDDIYSLVKDLTANFKNTGFQTSFLSSQVLGTERLCNTAAGIIYHSVSINNNNCIIWFRAETITEVSWGGDPNKAIVKDQNGLHPRNSFKLWKELVSCKSKAWLQPELNAAANYSYNLQKQVTLLALSEEEERYRKLTEVLKENNDELENINWISTHDLQEPLRKIQMMASRILEADEGALTKNTNNWVNKMNNSANRMQNLLKDILTYTKIKHTEAALTQVSLHHLINEILPDLDEMIQEKEASLVVKPLPHIKGVPFLLKQLFINLISNSLKFSSSERPLVITIEAVAQEEPETNNDDNQYLHVQLSDTGIGFEQKHAEFIFKIFSRLNTPSQYLGSGVGLALCKKIMKAHKGFITATGRPGEGAVFNLFFPVNQ